MTMFPSSNPNPRAIAQLFKLELSDMFNAWEASKPLRTGAPHASAILATESEWCVRRHVLSVLFPEQTRLPEQKPWTSHQNAVFLNGWYLHEKYQRLLSEYGNVIEVETSHYDETRMIHFTPDAIIRWLGKEYVVEIKGYHADTFNKLNEAGEPPQAAWHQCNLYCHLLKIEHGMIIVENKNTQEYKVWCIQHDASLARGYTNRCYTIKKAVHHAQTSGKLPERVCSSCQDRLAEKCPMKNVCFQR